MNPDETRKIRAEIILKLAETQALSKANILCSLIQEKADKAAKKRNQRTKAELSQAAKSCPARKAGFRYFFNFSKWDMD